MRQFRVAISFVPLAVAALAAQAMSSVPISEFTVPWGREGRPRDPAVAPDGKIFFVGQQASYVARLDPKTGDFKKYAIDSTAHPHNCVVDSHGQVWFSGNANGTLNRLDPATGAVATFDVATSKFRIVKIPLPEGKRSTNPYGIVLDSKGRPWFNLFNTNTIGTLDPVTFELKTYKLANDSTRDRRIGITTDGKLYYTDYVAAGSAGSIRQPARWTSGFFPAAWRRSPTEWRWTTRIASGWPSQTRPSRTVSWALIRGHRSSSASPNSRATGTRFAT